MRATPRFAVVLVGFALAAAGLALWRADGLGDAEPVDTDSVFSATRPIAVDSPTQSNVTTLESEMDAAVPVSATVANGSFVERDKRPLAQDDAELRAAFEELLNDPDPRIRHEAAQVGREFGLAGNE